MPRIFTLAACAALLAASAACASGGGSSNSETSASAPAASAQAAPSPGGYSDAQIQSYVAARAAIGQLTPGATAEAQAANQAQISQILQQNNLTPDLYNRITQTAQTDQSLANRIAAESVGDSFTDAQLRAFVAAATEIQPLNQQLATATPEQRTALGEQIRAVLQRNNLTFEQFNGIATQAQSDPALAARINTLRAEAAAETPATSTEPN